MMTIERVEQGLRTAGVYNKAERKPVGASSDGERRGTAKPADTDEPNKARVSAEKRAQTAASETQSDALSKPKKRSASRRRKKERQKILLLIIIAALLLVIAAGAVIWALNSSKPQPVDSKYLSDARATEGLIAGRSPEEIQALLDQIVEEGMFNVSMNGQVTVQPNGEADVCIENIAANRYLMRVDIIVTDSVGKQVTVYESGTIKPGYCVETGKFKVLPPVGTIDALAVFTALDAETLAEVGKTNLDIILTRKG